MNFMFIGALFGAIAVILGAFGAHALKKQFDDYQLSIWQTAVEYQMYHALLLIVVGWLMRQNPSQWLQISGISLSLGILLFSGSLYALAFSKIKLLGAITPLGGLGFIIGWAVIAYWALQK